MKRSRFKPLLFMMIFLFTGLSSSYAVELYIPKVETADASAQGDNASLVEIPIMLDQARNLAGVKIVMTYNKNALEYEKASKTKHTSSLMHIVNSKNPGRLIIVMAGAMGINGRDIPLLTLHFRLKLKTSVAINSLVKIKMAELMDAKLKTIEVKLRNATP